MNTLQKLLLGLAAAVGITTGAQAITPLVTWNGDLANNSGKKGFTMTFGSNAAESSGSAALTAKTSGSGNTGVAIDWENATFSGQTMTVLVQYSGMKQSGFTGNTALLATYWGSSDKSTETLLNANGTQLKNAYNVTSSASGNNTTLWTRTAPEAGLMRVTFSSSGMHFTFLTGSAGAWTKTVDYTGTADGLKKSASFYGIKIGGSIAGMGSYYRPGMTVSAVSILDSDVTDAELTTFTFPSQKRTYKAVHSLNFGASDYNVSSGTTPMAIVDDDNWYNFNGGSSSTGTAGDLAVTYGGSGNYQNTGKTPAYLKGYLDDNGSDISITVENLTGPAYDVIIYCNSDNATGWNYKTVNGKDYYASANGLALPGSLTWGGNTSTVSVPGDNVMIIRGVTPDAGGLISISSSRNSAYRGCIAAVQLGELDEASPNEYALTLSDDAAWQSASWVPSLPDGGMPSDSTATVTAGAANPTLTLDGDILCGTLKVVSETGKMLTIKKDASVHTAIGSLDVSGAVDGTGWDARENTLAADDMLLNLARQNNYKFYFYGDDDKGVVLDYGTAQNNYTFSGHYIFDGGTHTFQNCSESAGLAFAANATVENPTFWVKNGATLNFKSRNPCGWSLAQNLNGIIRVGDQSKVTLSNAASGTWYWSQQFYLEAGSELALAVNSGSMALQGGTDSTKPQLYMPASEGGTATISATTGQLRLSKDKAGVVAKVETGSTLLVSAPLVSQASTTELHKYGAGILKFTGTLSGFAAPLAVKEGTVEIASTTDFASGATLPVSSGATLKFGAADNTCANVISGEGSVVKAGEGTTTTLTGANTYTGGTTIEAGTLEVTAPVGSYTINGGTLKLSYDVSTGGTLTLPTIAANSGSAAFTVTMSKAQIQAENAVEVATLDASITTTDHFTATVLNADTGNETVCVLSISDNKLLVTPQGAKQTHVYTPATSGDFTWQAGVAIDDKNYRDYDDITFATATPVLETTVNVAAKVAAETVTVGGKYAFTNATILATTLRTAEGADATFENDVLADSVIVTNGTVMANEIVASEVAVTNATFGSKVVGPSMKYVRLSITETQTSGEKPAVGEFRLYRGSATTGYTIVDWPKGTKISDSTGLSTTKETSAYPGEVGTGLGGCNGNEKQPGCLIDGYYGNKGSPATYGGGSYNTPAYNKWWPNGQASGPWTVTVEFPDPVPTFSGCNFCLADHAPRNPTAWTIEVSSDGENWTTVNTTSNATWDAQYAWKGGDENVPGFLNSGTTPTDVKVGTGSTIVADGTWTAALEVGGDVTFKGVEGKYLSLDAASSSSFDAGAALTFDLTDYGVTTAGKQYVIAGPTEGWPETTAIAVTPSGKFDLYKDGEGYYVLVRSGNYWIGDQADGVGTWDLSETMAWGADAETADKSVWLNGVPAFFTRSGTVTIDAEADILPTAIYVTSNNALNVTFKGAIEKLEGVPFNIGSTNVSVTIENTEAKEINSSVTALDGTNPTLVKTGSGELTLNTAGFANLVVEAGTLKIGSDISLSGKRIEVKAGATLDPNGQSLAGATLVLSKSSTLTLTDVPTLTGTTIVIADAETLVAGQNYELIKWTNWPNADLLGYGMPTLELTGFTGKSENVRLVPGVYGVTLQYRTDEQVARKPFVIMPIGDSITEGLNSVGGSGKNYRIPLFNKLSLAGYNVKSVGFWKNNGSSSNGSYDPSGTVITNPDWIYHCGKGSERAGAIGSGNASVYDSIINDIDLAGNPDVVLLHIGINDMLNNGGNNDSDGTKTYQYLSNIVVRAVTAFPNTHFIISSPMCCEYGHSCQQAMYEGDGKADCNKNFCTPLHTMMTNFFALAKAGDIPEISVEAAEKISFADLYKNVMPRWYGNQDDTFLNDGSDKCHPNWLGHERMAETWFEQITNAFPHAENTDGHYTANPAEVPPSQYGAEANVPAEYRDGYVLVRRFEPTGTQRLTGGAEVPYAYTNEAYALNQGVEKVAYFFEYVRPTATTNLHRWVWADMDAFGTTLEEVGVPTKATQQKVVSNLHVYGNHPAVWNVPYDTEGVEGFVEFTPYGMASGASGVSGAPDNFFTFDWNDSLKTSGYDYGCMQLHRKLATADINRPAQVVFAFNGFTAHDSDPGCDFGIGNFAQSFTTASMDWTFARKTETLNATNLSYRAIEIWIKVGPTSPMTADVSGETDFSDIEWTDARGNRWTGLTAGYDYILTGSGTTTLDATLDAAATITVSNGTLKAGLAPTASCAITVEEGATFDVNGQEPGSSTEAKGFLVTLHGGTLVNTASAQGLVKSLTLTADSTIAVDAGNIWIQSGSGGWAATTLALDAFTLTKTGAGQFGLVSTTATGAGTVDVQAGELWIQESCGFGSATVKVGVDGTFHVESGKTATVANVTGVAGGTLNNEGTITAFTLTGALTIAGDGTFNTITLATDAVATVGEKRDLTFGGAGTVAATLTEAEFTATGDRTIFTVAEGASAKVGKVTYKDEDITARCTISGGTITAISQGEPELDPEQGSIEKKEGSDDTYVIKPSAGTNTVNVSGLPTGSKVEVPASIGEISGDNVLADNVTVMADATNEVVTTATSIDITAAFTKTQTGHVVTLTLNPSASVSVQIGSETPETIPVTPVLSDATDAVQPFVVAEDAVDLGVKTIPGLKYQLVNSADVTFPEAGTEKIGSPITAKGTRLALEAEKGSDSKSFYKVEVTR